MSLMSMLIPREFYISGSRLQRAQKSLHNIGAAVMNGGVTTFLAVVLLCDSKSHVMITFFKVFFLFVVFGLYHALVFLPVLLSFTNPFYAVTCTLNSEENKQKSDKSEDNRTCNEVRLTRFTNKTDIY